MSFQSGKREIDMKKSDVSEYHRKKENLVRQARQASKKANSYRGFQVGCAVLAGRKGKGKNRYRVFVGANLKPISDGPKICAEQIAIGAAISNGFERIIAIVVTGQPQPDSASGLNPLTLHPCWACRNLLESMPQVGQDTIILTTHNHSGPQEEHTLSELLARHENPGD